METYKVVFKDGVTKGVFSISLVEEPAMESLFVALSKQQEIKLATLDQEKRILLGAVLIPDKPIYRRDGEKEFNIVFDAETIRLSMENFARQGYHNESTIEHNSNHKLSNVTFVEMWIKEDEVHDKSVKYGLNEPIGTLYAAMKVNDQSVWDEYVKTGKVKGFSIDGFFDMERINLNKQNMMKTEEEKEDGLVNKFMVALKSIMPSFAPPPKVQLGMMTANNGELTIEFEGETVTPGTTKVSVRDGEGNLVDLPDGEYPMEDGTKWVVEGSMVKEVVKAEMPAAMGENPAEQPAAPAAAPVIKSEKSTQEIFYQLATTLGETLEQGLKDMEARLSAQIEAKQEAISLTKNKPELPEEPPKDAKGRIAQRLNQAKNQ